MTCGERTVTKKPPWPLSISFNSKPECRDRRSFRNEVKVFEYVGISNPGGNRRIQSNM